MGEMANVGARGGWLVGGARLVGDEREMDVVFEARLGGGEGGVAADPTAERARRLRGGGGGTNT